MAAFEKSRDLARLLLLDAATCAAMGILLMLGSGPIAGLTGLPAAFLFYTGITLLPVALYMWIVARIGTDSRVAVWLAILGNLAWVAASLGLFAYLSPNGAGTALVLLQAAAVVALAWLEFKALRASLAGRTAMA